MKIRFWIIASVILALAGCSGSPTSHHIKQDGPPLRQVNVTNIPNPTPRPLPLSRYGNPDSYVVDGKRYRVLKSAAGYRRRGIASWYGRKFQGRLTSSREPYDMLAMTAASPNLPIPTYVRVTNLDNERSVIVKVNDRGPFKSSRIIDLSYAAAKKLGFAEVGTAPVQVTAINMGHPERTQLNPLGFHSGHSFLQVGAFRYQEHAKRLKWQLQKLTARRIQIKTDVVNRLKFYRVLIGPLENQVETETLQLKLTRDGFGKAITVTG